MIGGAIGEVSVPSIDAVGFLALGWLLWLVGHRHHGLREAAARGLSRALLPEGAGGIAAADDVARLATNASFHWYDYDCA